MKNLLMLFSIFLFFIVIIFTKNLEAKKIYVSCDEPRGTRYDFETKNLKWKQIEDGYSNSYPTFIYDTESPEELRTKWPSGNPLNIDPMLIEKIVKGESKEKVLIANDTLIESYENEGTNSWITRLYPKKGIGIFLRHGYYLDDSLIFGAIYKSNCRFKSE